MPLNWPTSSHTMAAEYQISGIPFVITSADNELATGATAQSLAFPQVTQFVVVQHNGVVSSSPLRVGFTEAGVEGRGADPITGATTGENYFLVHQDSPPVELPVRCKELWFANDDRVIGSTAIGFSLLAGLTHVPKFLQLTGSDGVNGDFEGVG